MKKLFISSIVVAVMVAVPLFSSAATYQYVNTSGGLSTVTANSAAQALTVSGIAPTSGVRLVSDSLSFTGFVPIGANTYEYVDIYGNIKTVTANSAAQALTVSDIAPTSGVIFATGASGIL